MEKLILQCFVIQHLIGFVQHRHQLNQRHQQQQHRKQRRQQLIFAHYQWTLVHHVIQNIHIIDTIDIIMIQYQENVNDLYMMDVVEMQTILEQKKHVKQHVFHK